jgi:glycosyltransferase involved in cell wall biosynthesis
MRITVVSEYGYWGNFVPTDIDEGLIQVGGGETAMISISRELAALGHEVFAFYDTARPGKYHGVDYFPTAMFVPMVTQMEHDVMIAWDSPHAFRFNDRAKVHVLSFQLNNAYIGPFDWVIDRYMHPSQWHADMFHELYPEMSTTKSVVRLTNGINFARYTQRTEKRNPFRVVYTSSPDRGLHHLLDIWPMVVEEVPEAELHVYYDMNRWMNLVLALNKNGQVTTTTERALILQDQMNSGLPNVTFHGGVGQKELAQAQLSAHVMAYPCDPVAPTEGFSMSVLEGIVAGLDVITTDADAFPELWSNAPGVTILPLPVDRNVWRDAIVQKLRNGSDSREIRIREDLSWSTLARRWERELNECLASKQSP